MTGLKFRGSSFSDLSKSKSKRNLFVGPTLNPPVEDAVCGEADKPGIGTLNGDSKTQVPVFETTD